MLIEKKTIVQLASQGHLTLQVPDIIIGYKPEHFQYNPVEFPDEYFCRLKGGYYTPCINREEGCLFLTRKGFEYFYDDLRKAFEGALARGLDRTDGGGWEAFVEEAEKHFQKVEEQTKKQIAKLEKNLEQYKRFKV